MVNIYLCSSEESMALSLTILDFGELSLILDLRNWNKFDLLRNWNKLDPLHSENLRTQAKIGCSTLAKAFTAHLIALDVLARL